LLQRFFEQCKSCYNECRGRWKLCPIQKTPSKTAKKTEAEWEEEVVEEVLGDALQADGSINFDKLRATGLTMTLDELDSEGDEDDEE